MRERYLSEFDSIWIDCLNGDKYRTGKLTPEGKPDPSVFSTDHNREGIQVGTAITLLLAGRNIRDRLRSTSGTCGGRRNEWICWGAWIISGRNRIRT